MNISVSDLLDYLECPYKARIKRQYKRWAPPGSALGIGIAFHKGLELKLAKTPIVGLDKAACLASCSDVKDGQVADKLLTHLEAYEMPKGEAISSEEAFSVPFGAHNIVGRLDGRWTSDGIAQWSLQGKTIASSRPIAAELNRVRLSLHEVLYHYLVSRCLGIQLAGTLVLVGVKLSKKAADEGQATIFHEYMPREGWEVDRMLPGLFRVIERYILDMDEPSGVTLRNTGACLGKYGNSPCPLFVHCHQAASLEGTLDTECTHVLEDRYTEVHSATPSLN